ncbi:unnamed protein product [Moneuplotes crassus]|uniref:histidine kinase n=1 Tax=Euplotes crassus TaxID=5936 RepID=A0AAD1XJL2_EUPCR|nr:unnamed protein product [Moneuplotes crassus]
MNIIGEQDSQISNKRDSSPSFRSNRKDGIQEITSREQLRNAQIDCAVKKGKSFLRKIVEIPYQFYETDRRFSELEAQIPKKEIDQLNKSAVESLKKSAVLLAFLNILLHIIKAFKSSRAQQDHEHVVGNFVFLVLSCVPIYFISKHPSYVQTYLGFINCTAFGLAHFVYVSDYVGHQNCYLSCTYCYFYFTTALSPSKKRLNSLVFTLTNVLNLYLTWKKIGELDNDILLSVATSILYYSFGAHIEQSRLADMYSIILKNNKLVKEKAKLMQEFPHPVLILPQRISDESKCYPNNQFEASIKTLNRKIQRLEKVKVILKKDKATKSQNEHCNLLQFLTESSQGYKANGLNFRKHAIIDCDKSADKPHNNFIVSQSNAQICWMKFSMKRTTSGETSKLNLSEWSGKANLLSCMSSSTQLISSTSKKPRTESRCRECCLLVQVMSSELLSMQSSTRITLLRQALKSTLRLSMTKFQEICLKAEKSTPTSTTSCGLSRQAAFLLCSCWHLSKTSCACRGSTTGLFTTNYSYFNVHALLLEICTLFETQCQSRDVALLIECDDQMQFCEVNTDRNRVRQVLLNLVSNSVKLTFKGSITLKAKMVKDFGGQSFVEFRVHDTGPGIKQEDQACLFKLFGVLEDNEGLNPDGCGLGLTISKKYVEILGGEIRVESVYGESTEMIFTILIRDIKNLDHNNRRVIYNPNQSAENWIHRIDSIDFRVSEEHLPEKSTINECKLFANNESKF